MGTPNYTRRMDKGELMETKEGLHVIENKVKDNMIEEAITKIRNDNPETVVVIMLNSDENNDDVKAFVATNTESIGELKILGALQSVSTTIALSGSDM